MSSQRGNTERTRAQKHKNRHVFKNDLHDKRPLQQKLNSLHISEVCQRCKDVIEWKIKYKKYKPLSQAKTCVKCQQRNIRKAYHVLCRDCARAQKVCAKCMKAADEVDIEPPAPTPEEELRLKVEMERLIKSLPERKRRAFQRYMRKGQVDTTIQEAKEEDDNVPDGAEENADAQKVMPKRVPHTRDNLLKKIEHLTKATSDDSDSDDFSGDEDDASLDEESESE